MVRLNLPERLRVELSPEEILAETQRRAKNVYLKKNLSQRRRDAERGAWLANRASSFSFFQLIIINNKKQEGDTWLANHSSVDFVPPCLRVSFFLTLFLCKN